VTERIAAAAALVGQDIYIGPTHSAAMSKIAQIPGLDPAALAKQFLSAEYGFITNEGRFVTRAEAFQIATAARQIFKNDLAVPELNQKFFQTVEPILDSSMLEDYASLRGPLARVH
jgi:hypothetical protein